MSHVTAAIQSCVYQTDRAIDFDVLSDTNQRRSALGAQCLPFTRDIVREKYKGGRNTGVPAARMFAPVDHDGGYEIPPH